MNLSDPKDVQYTDAFTEHEQSRTVNNGGSASYYELPADCYTLQDIIVKQQMDFTQGNIFKAVYRWEKKPDLAYNLQKIMWFAQDALDRLYEKDPNNPRGNCFEHKG